MINATVDLRAPFEGDTILEVRRGRMKAMPGLKIESGIDKTLCDGPVWVGKLGIEDDEHDLTFHGGIDKAVHGYCSSHYRSWQAEFPTAESRFIPGGFGENLVTAHMNERNICIGDVYTIGDSETPLTLQISLPRQPCFKLNHRFQLKNFAPNTWKLSRTGWYYRVLQEGYVQAGDRIRLKERRWPDWTIERVQEYLHRQTNNAEMNAALAAIEDMGEESRGAFRNRVAQHESQLQKATNPPVWTTYRLIEKTALTPSITELTLESTTPIASPDSAAWGSHIRIKLPNNLTRAYSITSGTTQRFTLAVSLSTTSRGGSQYIHRTLTPDTILSASKITAGITPNMMASNHVFIAGGVGITAFISLLESLTSINYSVTLHYAVRSAAETPFQSRLAALRDRVHIYDASLGQRLSIPSIIATLPWNSQLYVCGPKRMMVEAATEVRAAGIPEREVHFEAFEADVGGDEFEVEVVREGERVRVTVGEDESLLDVLRRRDTEFPSSCEVGNCGTCKVKVLEGRVEHRGVALSEEEKEGGEMLACVSRGIGRIAVEW